ncbi:MAG: hypothetical protein CEE38_14815 [Planctomycetes bacterium B3_Pla]|nr:MAG: hypothetical protein CEE38_14815 [Planctomycetes bacterium B3_Pla]
MKKYAIPIVVVLAVLAVTWSAFAQAQDRASQRERYQNMSPEEQAKFREQMRARGGGARRSRMSAEDQQKAIKAIEEALVKFKAAAQIQRPQGGYQDLSDDERNKLRQVSMDRRTALQAIVAQVALLEGRRQPEAEGARFMIINTNDLKPIQEAAAKEKAKETVGLLERLAARGSGRGFGRGRPGGQRPQGGQRGGQ